MRKRSPCRNSRSRGFKVKHTLQIILLLGVCFWLIYQVKHSHDKRKEFDENDAKLSVGTETAYQSLKFGRKDLHPGKDENIVEDESEEKDNKHAVRGVGGDQQEEDEKNKSDEMEDERVGGDDESDEDPLAEDNDQDEEFVDEEKVQEEESDEKESDSKEEGKNGSVKNHNSHEAREEQYKGDDASSAVTHDTGTTSTKTESLLENSDANSEINIRKSENRSKYTQESRRNQSFPYFSIRDADLAGGTSSNVSLSNAVNSSHVDNVTTTSSDSHSEAGSNLAIVIPGGTNNFTGISADTSFELNKTVIFSESNQTQNGTVNTTVTGDVKNVPTEGLVQGGKRISEENQPGSNSTFPVEIEKGHVAAGESSNPEGGELGKTTKSVASNETGNNTNTEMSETKNTRNISYVKENTDATKDGFKGDTQTDETSDSSDSHVLKSVSEVRIGLDKLPDIRNEGDIGDATATD